MKGSLKQKLSEKLPSKELTHVYNSYDIIGDIAIIRLPSKSRKYRKTVAEAIIESRKNIKTVLLQASPVGGGFRLRKLEHVLGENRTITIYKESGCLFSVDVAKCYFSPRLSYERMRLAEQVDCGEVVVNMFGGVGCFSVLIARHSDAEKVYSIDANAAAIQYARENVRLNGVYGKVIPILGDAKTVIVERLSHVADRAVMPLPEKALEYLQYAVLALKIEGGVIHYYDFEHAPKSESPIDKAKHKASKKLEKLNVPFRFLLGRIVRATGPNWFQIALDIEVKR